MHHKRSQKQTVTHRKWYNNYTRWLKECIQGKMIIFKIEIVLQTCFRSMMTDSWQYSQFTFLQEHSNVSWVFKSRLQSIFAQPAFGHLTTLKRHSDWCFLRYQLINVSVRQKTSTIRLNLIIRAGFFKARLSLPRISENFDFVFVAFQQGVLFIFFLFSFEHE